MTFRFGLRLVLLLFTAYSITAFGQACGGSGYTGTQCQAFTTDTAFCNSNCSGSTNEAESVDGSTGAGNMSLYQMTLSCPLHTNVDPGCQAASCEMTPFTDEACINTGTDNGCNDNDNNCPGGLVCQADETCGCSNACDDPSCPGYSPCDCGVDDPSCGCDPSSPDFCSCDPSDEACQQYCADPECDPNCGGDPSSPACTGGGGGDNPGDPCDDGGDGDCIEQSFLRMPKHMSSFVPAGVSLCLILPFSIRIRRHDGSVQKEL